MLKVPFYDADSAQVQNMAESCSEVSTKQSVNSEVLSEDFNGILHFFEDEELL